MTGPDSNGRYPNIFVAGFPKAGTSTLHRVIAEAGAVEATVKEPSVLLLDRPDDECFAAFAGYFLDAATGPLIDGSPYYIYDERAIDRMARLGSATHVLISVREPWRRLESAYLDQFTQGFETGPLQAALERELHGDPSVVRRAEREVSRDYLTCTFYGDYVLRLLSSPLRDRVRIVALEQFDEPSTKADLREWTGLPIPADWGRENTANSTTSAMPALVHGLAQTVGSRMPAGVHSRLAPLAKPAMAKLASIPLPTGRTPDLEVDANTKSSVERLLAVSNRQLLEVPDDLWLGDRPAWLLGL